MGITGTAQHEPGSGAPVRGSSRCARGLRSIPVPVPRDPLRSVSVHASARTGGGPVRVGAGDEDVRGIRVTHLGPAEVLPVHEWRFPMPAHCVDTLTAPHDERSTELLAAVRRHPLATPWDLAAHPAWSRPSERYERRMRIVADTGTGAHPWLPAARGLVVRSDGPVPTWTLTVR